MLKDLRAIAARVPGGHLGEQPQLDGRRAERQNIAGLDQRRRELAILRANGARPRDVFLLLALEGGAITLAGAVAGALLLAALILALGPWVQAHYGLTLGLTPPSSEELKLLGLVLLVGLIASLFPGWRAYRLSLADGLTPRV
jgi:putative ABC transport system permease protein